MNMVALVLILQLVLMTSSSIGGATGKVTVQLINLIEDGKTMTVDCRSADDDVGQKALLYGESYAWSFKPNFWKTTLYYCNVSWLPDVLHFHFDAYVFLKDQFGCRSDCRWLFAIDGVYAFNHTNNTWVFKFPWHP